MISVVIPAHNEERVIGDLLDALVGDSAPPGLEVVVVPNGCTDATAEIARRYPITVVERPVGGKPGALNAGDDAASHFPRFYVDADVVLTAADLEVMASSLGQGILAVAPTRVIDTSDSSPVVSAYHRIWDRLESTRVSLAGRGCYGVSDVGRTRWGPFPDLIADDGFVTTLFGPDERVNVESVTTTVVAPRRLRDLLARKRRSHQGNLQLEGGGTRVVSRTGWLVAVREDPRLVFAVPAYLFVTVLARVLAWIDHRRGRDVWGTTR